VKNIELRGAPIVNLLGRPVSETAHAVSSDLMNTDTRSSEFWQLKNGRSICIREIDNLCFVAFGYVDGLRKKGFRFLGRYETLQLAVETGGAFLCSLDITTFRYFRTCVAAGRFVTPAGSGRCGRIGA
jgi:hypothetical protein